MGAEALKTINTHVVDILGNVKGRDQPILMLDKAVELASLFPNEILLDEDTVFFDPFCKAGEILLACALTVCKKRVEKNKNLVSVQEIETELYQSKRYFALSPDERHHRLSLRTFLGNTHSHNIEYNHIIRNGNYLSEIDGKLNQEKFKEELKAMINYIKQTSGKKKIVAVGNPPYQENYDGDANNTGANPIYHLFLNSLMEHKDISEYVMVIPSRWFAGGRGKALKEFANDLKSSKKIVSIYDFENSREVFPTVDIKGGVCFIHWDSKHNGTTSFFNVKSNEVSEIDLSQSSIIIRDSLSRSIVEKIQNRTETFVSDIAWSWNPFNISSNYFEKNNESKNGDLQCFTKRMIIKKITKTKITKNLDQIDKYKVAYPKAVKTGGVPYSKEQLFILGKNQICSESYMIIDSFESQKSAKNLLKFLQNDLIRFLISLKKITQDITKETWSLVPYLDTSKDWTDAKLFEHFSITKEEQEYIKSKVEEWS